MDFVWWTKPLMLAARPPPLPLELVLLVMPWGPFPLLLLLPPLPMLPPLLPVPLALRPDG